MIHYAEALRPDGSVAYRGPAAQYQINERQLIAAIAEVSETYEPQSTETVNWWSMGRLDDLGFMMQSQLINSLYLDNWDFTTYPNPHVVIGDLCNFSEYED